MTPFMVIKQIRANAFRTACKAFDFSRILHFKFCEAIRMNFLKIGWLENTKITVCQKFNLRGLVPIFHRYILLHTTSKDNDHISATHHYTHPNKAPCYILPARIHTSPPPKITVHASQSLQPPHDVPLQQHPSSP